jgi:hypothetical protein
MVQLTLKLTDPGVSLFTAIFVPSLLCRLEGPFQPELPFVHREGVAPAIFHLGARGLGLSEPIALMRNSTLDKAQRFADRAFAQVGS